MRFALLLTHLGASLLGGLYPRMAIDRDIAFKYLDQAEQNRSIAGSNLDSLIKQQIDAHVRTQVQVCCACQVSRRRS